MTEKGSKATLERVQSAVYELLAQDWQNEAKAEHLLKILEDSVKL